MIRFQHFLHVRRRARHILSLRRLRLTCALVQEWLTDYPDMDDEDIAQLADLRVGLVLAGERVRAEQVKVLRKCRQAGMSEAEIERVRKLMQESEGAEVMKHVIGWME